jgi:hypothetical protein
MKTKYSLTLLALFVAAIAFGQLFKTSLTLTVRDETGNTVTDAEVQLFEKKEDYEKEVNAVFTGKTDKKGITKFKNMKSIKYYLLVKKGDKDNSGGGEEIGKLEDGKFNKATVVIQ